MLADNVTTAAEHVGIAPQQLMLALQIVTSLECADGKDYLKLHWHSLAPYVASTALTMSMDAAAAETPQEPAPVQTPDPVAVEDARLGFFEKLKQQWNSSPQPTN